MHRVWARRVLGHKFLSHGLPSSYRNTAYNAIKPRKWAEVCASLTFSTSRFSSNLPPRSTPRNDTIYALSTGHGKAGIAVIRISGPSCQQVYRRLCPGKAIPKPRYAVVRSLFHPENDGRGDILDSAALALYFPGPKTVTGEDVLELHVHGGSATVKAVLSAIPKCSKDGPSSVIRYAEPGEFTRRAFLNDRLDLAQVEALSETLSAETEIQRRAAVRGHSGKLGRTYEDWRHQLLLARAEMEALIDFSEDQHFDESPLELMTNVSVQIREILDSIRIHERAGERSELIRNGIKIALLGPPNAGKSSLMNQLVGREASIVSHESGTTRDIVEANLDIRGYLCTFADTAGFRTAPGPSSSPGSTDAPLGAIEEEGIRRARIKAEESDLVVVLASIEEDGFGSHTIRYDSDTLKLAAAAQQRIIVINKSDAVPQPPGKLQELVDDFKTAVLGNIEQLAEVEPVLISCKEAQKQQQQVKQGKQNGMDPGRIGHLADRLVSSFSEMTSLPPSLQELHGVTERQRQLLEKCRGALENYMNKVRSPEDEFEDDGDGEADITMAAEDLRAAANYLSRITGRGEAGDVDEVLGVIFEKFCVGK